MDSNCNYIDGGGVSACCYLNHGCVQKKPHRNMIFRSVKVDFWLFEGRLSSVGLYLQNQCYITGLLASEDSRWVNTTWDTAVICSWDLDILNF